MSKEVKLFISKLKKGEISVFDIPKEIESSFDIIKAERKLGLRKIIKCGYDVILDKFFVEEGLLNGLSWEELPSFTFDDFSSFMRFVEGNVYDNSCYYQIPSEKLPDGIDLELIRGKSSFIENSIDDFTLFPSNDEVTEYQEIEKSKPLVKKWVDKFYNSTTYQQLKKTVQNYKKSPLSNMIDLSFFFWSYIFASKDSEERFQAIMEYASTGVYPSYIFCKALCKIYDPDVVVKNYNYDSGSYQSNRKQIRALSQIAAKIKNKEYRFLEKGYFDTKTHFFCVETEAYEDFGTIPTFSYKEYFETVDVFVKRLNYNLFHCDLSKAINVDFDFSCCKIDRTTCLPIREDEHYDYSVEKSYRRNKFYVIQTWKSKNGSVVKQFRHSFTHFCDFVAFLKGDLSGADLISCEGLEHLSKTEGLNFADILTTSSVALKLGIPFEKYTVDAPNEISLDVSSQNEKTLPAQSYPKELAGIDDKYAPNVFDEYGSSQCKVYYISDIHLIHLIRNREARNKNDIVKIIRDLVETIVNESDYNSLILVNGDTSLDFSLFELFVSDLAQFPRTVVFTIGNHDIWSCPNDSFDQLSEKYRLLLANHGMYLLQNNALFFEESIQSPIIMTEEELINSSESELRNRVRSARMILFGGTGFAGYNQLYNAETGLYRYNNTIKYSRKFEIEETKKFELLYDKVCRSFYGKHVIIMTHMPISDWSGRVGNDLKNKYYTGEQGEYSCYSESKENNYLNYSAIQPGFVYTSGHTHRNYYYDDGETRVYADNQFGYNISNPKAWPHLKYFEIDGIYDYFSDLEDGICEISVDEYRRFYRGKNIRMDCNRKLNKIFMLKKNNHYCFIHKSTHDVLSIMNGGSLKHLKNKDIQFYYENMDKVISFLKMPLDKYTSFQQKISKVIKDLGGNGSIHGCIVDIDFFNHIFVNPADGAVTGYYAKDTIFKVVYPSILSLLEAHCPTLFNNYKKLEGHTNEKSLILSVPEGKELTTRPVLYLETEMYRASKQIKKMQRLYSNILSTWPDHFSEQQLLEK